MNPTRWRRTLALVCLLGAITAGCTDAEDEGDGTGGAAEPTTDATTDPGTGTEAIDYSAIGLWDDGPCDESLEPLHLGLLTTFATPVISLEDQALALEAAAVAFNGRGGANGHCIEVTTCDEGADPNRSLDCVRTLDDAGISATINDTSTVVGEDVPSAFEAAGIPRFAISPGTQDNANSNSYPFDAGGLGTSMMMPQGLLSEGITRAATIRVDLPTAGALNGIFESIYTDDGLEILADIPVASGTTDYTQFIIAAQDSGAEGVILPLGAQESIQVLRAAQQLAPDLVFSGSLGTFSHADLESLGDFADQVVLNGSSVPATADVPVVRAIVADLAASGEESLQLENLKTSPMRSWIGLYALLQIIRSADTDDFSRSNLVALIEASGPIDMLGLTDDWTPLTNNPGNFPRTGNGHYGFWRWDAAANDGDGDLVQASEANFVTTVCGSAVGGPAGTC